MDKSNILVDITNISSPTGKCQKRLKDGTFKVYTYNRKPRKTIELTFENDSEKLEFEEKFNIFKEKTGSKPASKALADLFDNFEPTQGTNVQQCMPEDNLLRNEDAFVCTKGQLFHLINIINSIGPVDASNFERFGHVGQIQLRGTTKKQIPITWNSSPPMKDNFTVNYMLVHAYLASGLLPVQYEKFCNFSKIGTTPTRFRSNMYTVYGRCVDFIMKREIKSAIREEMKATENVPVNSRTIDIMTDARHACRKNSFHSDITALGQRTHRVVNYQHITKQDDICSQRHEMVGTRKLYAEFDRDNITIRVHSHDRNASVSKFLRTDYPNTRDSYDTTIWVIV